MIRQGDHDQVAGSEACNRFQVQLRVCDVGIRGRIRPTAEATCGKRSSQGLRITQASERSPVLRADANSANVTQALKLIERRQELIVNDHSTAYDRDLERAQAIAPASSNASSSTPVLSRIAS